MNTKPVILALRPIYLGCWLATNDSRIVNGSDTASGGSVNLNMTTRRDSINVVGQALITVRVSFAPTVPQQLRESGRCGYAKEILNPEWGNRTSCKYCFQLCHFPSSLSVKIMTAVDKFVKVKPLDR